MSIELNPQYITSNGTECVLLTKQEYEYLQEQLEDMKSFKAIQEAKAQDNPKVRIPFEEIPD
jgi:PHD/YefM family antitoxin component YafN of YafNO toxin-antitoxin module